MGESDARGDEEVEWSALEEGEAVGLADEARCCCEQVSTFDIARNLKLGSNVVYANNPVCKEW